MHFQGRARSAFFEAWEQAGLPEPRLDRDRPRLRRTDGLPTGPMGDAPPLHPDVRARVYGFGAAIGWVLGRLSGLDEATAHERSVWCGRFNVGISLYDWVCDETGRGQVLASVAPFAGLAGRPATVPADLRDEERVLCDLATGLLAELDRHADDSWDHAAAMAAMLRAQHEVAAWHPDAGADFDRVSAALSAKSVDPFVVMARWMAAGDVAAASEVVEALGRGVGRCVWVVDDATDLWRDLDARAWNLFLVRAVDREPRLLDPPRTTLTDIHLDRVLTRDAVAEVEAAAAVADLATAVTASPVTAEVRDDALAVVAAGLAAW